MRAKLFWKLGLTYLVLLLAGVLAVDLFSAGILQRDYRRAAEDQLTALSTLALARPPRVDDPVQLRAWVRWMSRSGVRVTVIDRAGLVLADSAPDAETSQNQSSEPEIREAFEEGSGQSVRRSPVLNRNLLYRAVRYRAPTGTPVVIRMALPLAQADLALAGLHRRLLFGSLVILLLGGVFSFVFSHKFSLRVERLKDFSRRVAEGDFRSLPAEGPQDELADLAEALNGTAARLDGTIQSLRSERNRSGAILRSMIEGVVVVDAQERVVFCNRAFSEILNLGASGIEGRPVLEVVRDTGLLTLIRRALRGEEGLTTDIAIGIVQQRTFSVTATPVQALEASLPLASGLPAAGGPPPDRPSGAVVVLHDVSELRRLERVRQDFVANVSHEFKTPLTAIQGFAETLLGGALDDPQNGRRFIEIIREHAARLARLTDDLLKLARIEAGKLELEFHPVSITELVEGCAETTLLKASRKQIALNVEIPPQLPAVRGDASLLREVLQNLFDNAIQYTQPGGRICVSATAGPHEATITVSDSGMGIPLADQERIFERFYRVDAARSREAGGTGLGLSIARHIVEAHRGRIWVESEVGAGSKFSFSIPLAA